MEFNLVVENKRSGFYLTGKRKNLEFVNPVYKIERDDSEELRQKVLDVSSSEWKKMEFSKGTLHYMKQNAKSAKSFTLNVHVKERLENWDYRVSVVKSKNKRLNKSCDYKSQ